MSVTGGVSSRLLGAQIMDPRQMEYRLLWFLKVLFCEQGSYKISPIPLGFSFITFAGETDEKDISAPSTYVWLCPVVFREYVSLRAAPQPKEKVRLSNGRGLASPITSETSITRS